MSGRVVGLARCASSARKVFGFEKQTEGDAALQLKPIAGLYKASAKGMFSVKDRRKWDLAG